MSAEKIRAMAESSGQAEMSYSMKATVYATKKRFPSVKNISCQELEQWRTENQNLILLDTRPVEEYEVSHLPGSIRVDPDKDPDPKELGVSSDSTVVCYCSVGYRSSGLAQKLFRVCSFQFGEPLKVRNLEGGVFQWVAEGRELVDREGKERTVVHPYNSLWGKLLSSNHRHKL